MRNAKSLKITNFFQIDDIKDILALGLRFFTLYLPDFCLLVFFALNIL